MSNEENELVECSGCGKKVPDWTIDRYGECAGCRAEERSHDMCVGDRHDK